MKSTEDLKSRLKILADTGNTGTSAVAGMEDVIKGLPADKSGPMMKDWEDMKKAGQDTAMVKAIAKRMMDRL